MSEPKIPRWNASFPDCVVELKPSPRARLYLLSAGWLTLLLGSAFIVRVEISVWVKLILLPAWWLDGAGTLARMAGAQRWLKAVRLRPSGDCEAVGPGFVGRPARLLSASIVTQHWAWLRVADEEGRIYSELILRGGVEAIVWRRFQVLSQWGLCH